MRLEYTKHSKLRNTMYQVNSPKQHFTKCKRMIVKFVTQGHLKRTQIMTRPGGRDGSKQAVSLADFFLRRSIPCTCVDNMAMNTFVPGVVSKETGDSSFSGSIFFLYRPTRAAPYRIPALSVPGIVLHSILLDVLLLEPLFLLRVQQYCCCVAIAVSTDAPPEYPHH